MAAVEDAKAYAAEVGNLDPLPDAELPLIIAARSLAHCGKSREKRRLVEKVFLAFIEHTSKAGLNRRNASGATALSVSAALGLDDACESLLEAGADPSIAISDGRTPRELAKVAGFDAVVKAIDEAVAEAAQAKRGSSWCDHCATM